MVESLHPSSLNLDFKLASAALRFINIDTYQIFIHVCSLENAHFYILYNIVKGNEPYWRETILKLALRWTHLDVANVLKEQDEVFLFWKERVRG